jgi:hypothetical protein
MLHARPALLQPSSEVYHWRKIRRRSSPEQSRHPRWPPPLFQVKSPFCVPAQRSHGPRPVAAAPAEPTHGLRAPFHLPLFPLGISPPERRLAGGQARGLTGF